VRSNTIYNKLMSIDTLLSFDGIISSLPDFQLKLVTLIEQFHQSLIFEQKSIGESERLCRTICFYLDNRINSHLDRHFSSWDGFLLEQYFYGYDKDQHSIYYRINLLMKTSDIDIYAYAYKLLFSLADIIGYDEKIRALLSKYTHQDTHISPLGGTVAAQEFLDDDYSIINTSKRKNGWIYQIVLLASISIIIVSIVWLCCYNYINNFQ